MEDMIDIIMPAYNCEKYIKKAIKSVKMQTISNWRLIIINDASTDNTQKEIETSILDIKEKVKLVQLKQNVGVANTRNIALEQACSRYIAFMDADDIWNKQKLEKQLKFMKKNGYEFTYTLYEYLKDGKRKEVRYFPKNLTYKQALKNTFILTSTVMIDTKQIAKEYIKMPNIKSEDTATWWKILKTGKIAYGLKENLVSYRVTKQGLSANKFENLKRTWNLYTKQEKLPIILTIYYFLWYIFRATIKRII